METKSKYLVIAAGEAILQWINKEQTLIQKLKSSETMTLDDLKKWLGYWMLARGNPVNQRDDLLKGINEFLRPSILSFSDDELPKQIYSMAKQLKHLGGTTSIQTSLVSKFAFCMRPELIVPIDERARKGLALMYGKRIGAHNYESYFESFLLFKRETAAEMQGSNLLDDLKPYWKKHMSEDLFLSRTTDKFLMLEGGFNVKSMEKNVGDHFGNDWIGKYQQ